MMRPLAERLWAQVEPTGFCWLWTGYCNRSGYGRIGSGGRAGTNGPPILVHRAAYELLVGPIPEGMLLDHLCRVRNCVNPDHLEPVTIAENTRRGFAVRSACQRGHLMTDDNTYSPPSRPQARYCRECGLLRKKGLLP